MAYKIKSKKEPDYAEIESRHFQEEHKTKRPKFLEITREGTRQAMHVPEISHRKGSPVMYKERLHVVVSSSAKGVWLQPMATKKEVIEDNKVPERVFVEEKKYEKEVEPVFVPVPFYFVPMMTLEK